MEDLKHKDEASLPSEEHVTEEAASEAEASASDLEVGATEAELDKHASEITENMATEKSDAKATSEPPPASDEGTPSDYEEMAAMDLLTLQAAFPETRELSSLYELEGLRMFAALRAAGHPARIAYLLSRGEKAPAQPAPEQAFIRRGSGDKEHLTHRVSPHGSFSIGDRMSYRDMAAAQELFQDLTPHELLSLYRRAKG